MEVDVNKNYTFTEIGNYGWLGVGPAGVYNLIQDGRLTAMVVGTGKKNKRYAIKGEEVLRFLADPKNIYIPEKKV